MRIPSPSLLPSHGQSCQQKEFQKENARKCAQHGRKPPSSCGELNVLRGQERRNLPFGRHGERPSKKSVR